MQEDRFTDNENPYAVSEGSFSTGSSHPTGMRVDGNMVVVGKPAALPRICVVSGETEDLISFDRTLTYVSPVVIFVFVISRIIGLIMYLMMRKQTPTTFYLARSVRTKMRWLVFYGLLFLAAAIALIIGFVMTAQQGSPWLIAIPAVLFIVGLIFIVKGTNLLGVKKYNDPDQFWIKGCKEPFFQTLAQQPELAVT